MAAAMSPFMSPLNPPMVSDDVSDEDRPQHRELRPLLLAIKLFHYVCFVCSFLQADKGDLESKVSVNQFDESLSLLDRGLSRLLHLQWPLVTNVIETPETPLLQIFTLITGCTVIRTRQ